ncbi:MAG: homoserine dehydrogenase [Clostridia bacterium]|nr:homoserine dehydrogenase [Clostridia bacterium]
MKKFAIMGHGVVGTGVAQLFLRNKAKIEASCGHQMEMKYILDIRQFEGTEYDSLFVTDFSVIENDPEISVVVETIGGTEPAFDYVSRCLKAGKSVVTSNKELIATRGTELLALAEQNNVALRIEACVGGGIPLIKPVNECLIANRFWNVEGILNGTTNFILNKMQDGVSYADALAIAQGLGYAERNPSADVDGHDCARKISILTGLAFGAHIDPDHIRTVGIRGITLEDIRYANLVHGAIKLISRAARSDEGVYAAVEPMFVTSGHMLSSVKDVFNACVVDGDATGDVMFYGKGAGKFPTASAVISDLVDAAREGGSGRRIRWQDAECGPDVFRVSRYYVRFAREIDAKKLTGAIGSYEVLGALEGGFAILTEAYDKDVLLEKLSALGGVEAVMPVLEGDR